MQCKHPVRLDDVKPVLDQPSPAKLWRRRDRNVVGMSGAQNFLGRELNRIAPCKLSAPVQLFDDRVLEDRRIFTCKDQLCADILRPLKIAVQEVFTGVIHDGEICIAPRKLAISLEPLLTARTFQQDLVTHGVSVDQWDQLTLILPTAIQIQNAASLELLQNIVKQSKVILRGLTEVVV